MIRPSPPPVVPGDHAMVRPNARHYCDVNLGYRMGIVADVMKRDGDRIDVFVYFPLTGELIPFPLSELSIVPNLEARRGEVA